MGGGGGGSGGNSGVSGVVHGHRTNLAPQSMQWAIRNRDSAVGSGRPSGVRVASGSSLVFIDPSSLRRSTSATAAVAAAAAASHEPVTMATTASCLARAFGIVLRQMADLLALQPPSPALPRNLQVI